MSQYIELCKRVISEGKWIKNERTGERCLTVINADLEYDVANNVFPLDTTRKSYWKSAIAELLGYLRGYDSAEQFRAIGCKSWDQNANDNKAWLSNPNRKGVDDMGFVYGAVGRAFPKPDGGSVDLLHKIVNNLSKGVDDRGEILTFYHPGSFHLGCLRPCMYEHQFSILDGHLYLNSTQRSCDLALGISWNQMQCFVLLALIARISGLKPAMAYHKLINIHLYEKQVPLMKEQVERVPYEFPTLTIDPSIKTLEDIETWVTTDHFQVDGYQHHPAIAYPFTV